MLLFLCSVNATVDVLAQAEMSVVEAPFKGVATDEEVESEVLLSTQELQRIVGRIQRVRASRTRIQPIYLYPNQVDAAPIEASTSDLEQRMSRIEASLDILVRNAKKQPQEADQPQAIMQQQPIASGPTTSDEVQLLQYELVQLRSELSATRARLNERMLLQGLSPAEERRLADQQRALQKQQDERDRNAQRESEDLREEIRKLEKAISKNSTKIISVPAQATVRVDTIVQVVNQTSIQDTSLVSMLQKQEAQLAALRDELAAAQAVGQETVAEPTIVYRDREVVRQADPIRVTDTLRIERTIERVLAPRIIDVSAVLFGVGSSELGARSDKQLTQAVDSYRQHLGKVQLRGWSSPEGQVLGNRQLSLKRAQAVRDELVLRGVPPTAIHILEGGIDEESLSLHVARRVEIQLLVD